jgi:hypothetical protein
MSRSGQHRGGREGVAPLAGLLLVAAAACSAPARAPATIDETKLTVLAGNTNPEAIAQYDVAPLDDAFPLDHMVSFGEAVPVSANTSYVASYFMPGGNFALDPRVELRWRVTSKGNLAFPAI